MAKQHRIEKFLHYINGYSTLLFKCTGSVQLTSRCTYSKRKTRLMVKEQFSTLPYFCYWMNEEWASRMTKQAWCRILGRLRLQLPWKEWWTSFPHHRKYGDWREVLLLEQASCITEEQLSKLGFVYLCSSVIPLLTKQQLD